MQNISLQQGDITAARADAIINAANPQMLGGGGVDGAIHRAAGPQLLAACREVPANDGVRCPTGEARITPAGNLHSDYVIHTVGPRYGIDPNPPALLASAYRKSYQLALDYGCTSLAVPAVSCGVYGYPLKEAATIAMRVSGDTQFETLDICFYLFGSDALAAFSAALNAAN